MANSEHVRRLRDGVDEWNKWAAMNHGRIDLTRSDFERAKLGGAWLIDADLSFAKLQEADLRQADLSGANLARANLRDADLRHADLTGANLREADLTGANLELALIGWTIFARLDLREVKGLSKVHHLGPSTIGVDTICLSQSLIPEGFLRGCGVPDPFIRGAPSLIGEANNFYSAFISHSSKDADLAQRLCADLRSKGVPCWIAHENLKIGERFRDSVEAAIQKHDKLIIILSENSVRSREVEVEVEAAISKEKATGKDVLCPIRLDDVPSNTEPAWALNIQRTRQIGDFTQWRNPKSYGKALDELVRTLLV